MQRGCIRQRNGQRGYITRREQGVDLELVNQLPVPTTVHWHGLILPNPMDGVPYVTQPPIPPGERQRIHYPLQQTGPSGCTPITGCRPKALSLNPS